MPADGMIGTRCNRTSAHPVVLSPITLPHRHDDAKGGACQLMALNFRSPRRSGASAVRGEPDTRLATAYTAAPDPERT
jgi:hypothetical protein